MRHAHRRVLLYTAGALLALWSLVPLYWLINMSLMYRDELISRPAHFYPHNLTITNYLRITVGAPDQIDRLLSALSSILDGDPQDV